MKMVAKFYSFNVAKTKNSKTTQYQTMKNIIETRKKVLNVVHALNAETAICRRENGVHDNVLKEKNCTILPILVHCVGS